MYLLHQLAIDYYQGIWAVHAGNSGLALWPRKGSELDLGAEEFDKEAKVSWSVYDSQFLTPATKFISKVKWSQFL